MATKRTGASGLGGLSRAQGTAWGAFLSAHARLTREMSEELDREHGMPLTTYDALRQLALAPGGRLRMAELADRVMLSRPGLTGVVKRLEAEGLVTREPCDDDRRGFFAVLTERGLERLREAHPAHVRSIRERFADRFDEAELRTLGDLLGRL